MLSLNTTRPLPRTILFSMFLWLAVPLLLGLAPLHNSALAATYYIDPQNGSDSGDGSSTSPWQSLQHLFDDNLIESRNWASFPYTEDSTLVSRNEGALIQPGDTIFLRSGSYSTLTIRGYYNSEAITIQADEGAYPVFRNIVIKASSNWNLQGLVVDASAYDTDDSYSTLISLESHNYYGPISQITVRNCTLQSIADSSSWSKEDWNTLAKTGIKVAGTNMTINANSLLNINFGISVTATYSLVEHNTITNFAGDGLRGLGDYTTFQYNTVKNCYDVNDNHDDGFQSWSVDADGNVGAGVVKGIVLRGNTIINYEDPNQPFRGPLQGIGCFDGMFQGWTVEGNKLEVDTWHGIAFYGATDMVIRKNIVIDPDTSDSYGPPWIKLTSHKDGTASSDSEISCNLAAQILFPDNENIISQYNTLTTEGTAMDAHCRSSLMGPLLLPILIHKDRREI